MDDIRDRLARAEQDIKNSKENFQNFKSDEFTSLKIEVHAMRGEFNRKLDDLLSKLTVLSDNMQNKTSAINITMAKWAGGGAVAIAIVQALFKFFV